MRRRRGCDARGRGAREAAGSLLFFLLFWRSRYLPRALAGLGLLGSGLVVVMAATMFVIPERINELKMVGVPAFLAEVVTALWLLIKGLKPRAMAEARA